MVMQALGAGISLLSSGMGLFSSLFGGSKSSTASSKSLAKYQSDLDWTNYKRELKLQSQYQDRYLSNSAKATQNLNQRLMDYQYALERESRQSSYQDTRIDLEKAGYNPLLAVGQQSNYTPVSSGVSAQSDNVESMANLKSGIESVSALNSARNESRNTAVNEGNLDLQRVIAKYNNALTSAKTEYTRDMDVGQVIRNQIENVTGLDKAISDLDLTRQQKTNLEKTIDLITEQIKTEQTVQNLNSAKAIESKANAWFQRHRSLGKTVTDSWTSSDSYNNGDLSVLGVRILPSKGGSQSYSHTRSITK